MNEKLLIELIAVAVSLILGYLGQARARKATKIARGVLKSVKVLLKEPDVVANVDIAKEILKESQQDSHVRAGVRELLDT